MTISIKRETTGIVQNTVVVQSSPKTTQRLSTCLLDFYMTSYDYLPTGKLRVRVSRKNTEYDPATSQQNLKLANNTLSAQPGADNILILITERG